uniref:Uncharacterized protein n=1 Tax=Meloidogyne enterolobii TaxID=390850 RepID=A0A6V7VNG3_MELEN|nr:unnamed protein product [Meloidogyne enterolobii]
MKKPVGNCIKGNGFGNLINDENIKYILGKEGFDKIVEVHAKNSFKKPQNSSNYSLFYFEIKCEFEGGVNCEKIWMNIGLRNLNVNKYIYYSATESSIYNEKEELFKLSTLSFNNNDIFGCGLVYPPSNKINYKFPYIFFTQNGKQIGKGLKSSKNSNSYKPYVWFKCCSVEANFGNNLETKPFKYDYSKHLILEEFY